MASGLTRLKCYADTGEEVLMHPTLPELFQTYPTPSIAKRVYEYAQELKIVIPDDNGIADVEVGEIASTLERLRKTWFDIDEEYENRPST
jgi:hypothetical protein